MLSFEKLGKMMKKPSFFICFLFLSFAIPLITLFYFLQKEEAISRSLSEFQELVVKANKSKSYRLRKKRFLLDLLSKDPYFIPKKLEKLLFLENESQFLQDLVFHPAYGFDHEIQERYKQLTKNKLSFVVEKVKSTKEITETEEKQSYPIEVNRVDIEKILSLIEKVETPNGVIDLTAPQLFITRLELVKKSDHSYELFMHLIKREYHLL